MAKGGWWGGDPGKVKEAPTEEVMKAAQYDGFVQEYDAASIALNKDRGEG